MEKDTYEQGPKVAGACRLELAAAPPASHRGIACPPLLALPGGLPPPALLLESRRLALPRLVGVKAPTRPAVPWLPTEAASSASSAPPASLPPVALGGRLPL